MILLQATTWAEVGRLAVIMGLPTGGALIAFLTYLRGYFNAQNEERKVKIKEQNENREMFIKMVVEKTIDLQICEIRDMVKDLAKRVDELFILLTK